jgi:hypothetical protein
MNNGRKTLHTLMILPQSEGKSKPSFRVDARMVRSLSKKESRMADSSATASPKTASICLPNAGCAEAIFVPTLRCVTQGDIAVFDAPFGSSRRWANPL